MPGVPAGLARALADRYRIERELGRGGMATVWLAEDLKHHRRVAIKVARSEVAAAAGDARFRDEIAIAARLTHPHILPLHDSGVADGTPYYVMPWIEGETLGERLRREGPLPLDEALRLTREVASALGYAHQRGLVHRDIKPDNILLSDGIALVADFGIARQLAGAAAPVAQHTAPGLVVGTLAYLAPEQLLGSSDVDGRADLYSLACVLHEMLTGAPPFAGPPERIAHQHLNTTPPPVNELRAGLPLPLAAALTRALAKSPADRYPTAARLAEALTAAVAPGGGGAPVAAEARTAALQAAGPATPNNLPAERTTFIGHRDDLETCARLLEATRLLTLTGIGGAGKTRLALKVAEQVLPGFPDGVWFVDFAPLTEPGRVADALAQVLGLPEEAGRTALAALRAAVRGRRMLLVLDNCEHLLGACAGLADALLAAGDQLRIIATSREGLGVPGERVHGVRPLARPESVLLFADRARAVDAGFVLDDAGEAAVSEICRRLDGIPLAIELAAARARLLSLEQIRARLNDRFRLLTGGSKTGLPRHQTLRATIQWSYDQLTEEEQELFRRLSVFLGGWTLEAAAQVAGGGPDVTGAADEFEVLDLLARLVDKSLVLVERDAGGEPRYGMLETVRQYGQELLAAAGETPAVAARHHAAYAALAERAYAERIEKEGPWGAILEREFGNLLNALDTAKAQGPERHLELAGALAWFWQARSHPGFGHFTLAEALGTSAPEPPRRARARALWGQAYLLAWLGQVAEGRVLMDQALQMWRDIGDQAELALALEGLGWVHFIASESEQGRVVLEECLRLQQALGDPVRINRARVALAQVLVSLGDLPAARALSREVLTYSAQHKDWRSEHFGRHFLADCDLMEGRFEAALTDYGEALELIVAIGDRLETGFEVQGVAMSLAGLERAEEALQLAGATQAEFDRMGVSFSIQFWTRLLEEHLGRARKALDPEAAERAWAAGRAMRFDDAVARALRVTGRGGTTP